MAGTYLLAFARTVVLSFFSHYNNNSKSFNILYVTETWLSRSILSDEILPTNYTIYRNDRESRGGDVLIAISMIEAVVEISASPKIIICCTYAPPACQDSQHVPVSNLLIPSNGHLITLGDLNLLDIVTGLLLQVHRSQFCDLIFILNLTQTVDQPTHCLGNIVFTDQPHEVCNLPVDSSFGLHSTTLKQS